MAAARANRFTLGIGLSHKVVIENMFGLSYDKPVRHLREYLSVLMPLSRNEPANFDGEVYRVHAAVNANGSTGFGVVVAAPVNRCCASPRRWPTARSPGAPAGDPGRPPIPTITEAAERHGRPAPRVIAALPVCVTTDTEAATERAAQEFSRLRRAAQLPRDA